MTPLTSPTTRAYGTNCAHCGSSSPDTHRRHHGTSRVGKTFLATAHGHAAVRRRFSVHFERCDRGLKRLPASRLDNSHDVEMRKLLRVDVLIVDDPALQALDPLDTTDVYELIVERHRAAATVATSNREPIEWLRPDGRPAPRAVRTRNAGWMTVA